MKWTIWQNEPRREKLFQPIARNAAELRIQLVHWTGGTGEATEAGTECRVIVLHVGPCGDVTVEHSTTEVTSSGIDPEHVTRVVLPGWED